MRQGTIQETIQSIFQDMYGHRYRIDLTDNDTELLTAEQIAHILSTEEPKYVESQEETSAPSTLYAASFHIDLEKLDRELRDVNGLYQIKYYHPIYSCRKLIGKWIVWGKRIVRKLLKFLIEPILNDQSDFNAAVAQSLNSMRNNHVVFQAAINSICDEIAQQRRAVEALHRESKEKQEKLQQSLQLSQQQGQTMEAFQREAHETMERLQQDLQSSLGQIMKQSDDLQGKLKLLEKIQQQDDIYEGIDYFKFQEHMRGSRSEIKAKQREYLNYFLQCNDVLDLGCGRGEFLELLREHGVCAIGVDNYRKSIDYCRTRGLQVVQEDAIQYLCGQKTESIDGVFAAQLVEHISAGRLLKLCRECYRVMKSDGYIVLETPNPMCLSTYINSFYLDPSHKNPIHPRLLEYVLKECGFRNVKILFTESSKVGYQFPLLDSENCKNLEEFNDGVNFLSDIIFGSQDYAIVAQK